MSQDAGIPPENDGHAPVEANHGMAAPTTVPQTTSTMLGVGILGAAAAVLVWGTWVSKGVHDLRQHANQIVKVRLSDIVGDYVQTAARSGTPTEQAAQQTGVFLTVLNETVIAHSGKGQIVMLANAIVSGDVPDITDQVRTEVYAKLARPQNASGEAAGGGGAGGGGGDVQARMKQFMDANGAAPSGANHGQ